MNPSYLAESAATAFRAFRECCDIRRGHPLVAEWVQPAPEAATSAQTGEPITIQHDEVYSRIVPVDAVHLIKLEEVDGAVFVEGSQADIEVIGYGLCQLQTGFAHFLRHTVLLPHSAPYVSGLMAGKRGFDNEANLLSWALSQRAGRLVDRSEIIISETERNDAFEAKLIGSDHATRFWLSGQGIQCRHTAAVDPDKDPFEVLYSNLAAKIANDPLIDFSNPSGRDMMKINNTIANYLGLLQVSYSAKDHQLILDAAMHNGQTRHMVLPNISTYQELAHTKGTTKVVIPRLGSWFLSGGTKTYSAYAPVVVVHPSQYAADKRRQKTKPVRAKVGSLDFLETEEEVQPKNPELVAG